MNYISATPHLEPYCVAFYFILLICIALVWMWNRKCKQNVRLRKIIKDISIEVPFKTAEGRRI
jgi:hypothetical protein